MSDDHWLDIATGRRVTGRLLPKPVDETRVHACLEASMIWRDGARRLIDYGDATDASWFEVWNVADDVSAPIYELRHLSRRVISYRRGTGRRRLARTARDPHSHLRGRWDGDGIVGDRSRAATVGLRHDSRRRVAAARRCPTRVVSPAVALVDTPRARRDGTTVAWTADLVRASNRAHVVLSLVSRDAPADSSALEIEPIDPGVLAGICTWIVAASVRRDCCRGGASRRMARRIRPGTRGRPVRRVERSRTIARVRC